MTTFAKSLGAAKYGALVQEIAGAMVSANVVQESLSGQPDWEGIDVMAKFGNHLVQIATILQIEPGDLSDELARMVRDGRE